MPDRATLFLFIISALWLTDSLAQSTAVPLLSEGKSQFALSLQGGMVQQSLQNDQNRLFFLIGRPTMGFAESFDVYGLIGWVKQQIDYSDNLLSDFKSNRELLFGGGISWKIPWQGPFNLAFYTISQAQIFRPTGKSYESIELQKTGLRKIRHTTYQWVQLQSALFLTKRMGSFNFFIGSEILHQSIHLVTQISLEQDKQVLPVNRLSGLYQKRTLLQPSLGLNIYLPNHHQLGLQLRGSNLENFGIFIGLGQTGSPD